MQIVSRQPSFLLLLLLVLAACQKGESIDQGKYMRLTLGIYHPDTSVFGQVKINGEMLTNSQQYHGDEPFNLFLQYNTTQYRDSALLDVLMVKSSGASLKFQDTVQFRNVNNFFLFQTCPDSDPILINRDSGESQAPLPSPDSVKVRFFFSTSDKISNPNPGYTGRLLHRMRVQVYTFTPSANPNNPPASSSFIPVISAVDFNECGLSEYITLAKNKKYGFRLRDISTGIPSSASANLVQQLLPANDIQLIPDPATGFADWDFKRGKIFINKDGEKLQTLRVKRSPVAYFDINGNDYTEISYNASFVIGMDK